MRCSSNKNNLDFFDMLFDMLVKENHLVFYYFSNVLIESPLRTRKLKSLSSSTICNTTQSADWLENT